MRIARLQLGFQIDDPQPKDKWRRPPRRLHEMALHDYSHLGRVSPRELAVGGIEITREFLSRFWKRIDQDSPFSNFFFRWASILKPPNTDGSESGLWCCTAPESPLTLDFRRRTRTRSWRSWRRLTRNGRQPCNDRPENDPRDTFISRDVRATTSLIVLRISFLRGRQDKKIRAQHCYATTLRYAFVIVRNRSLVSHGVWKASRIALGVILKPPAGCCPVTFEFL